MIRFEGRPTAGRLGEDHGDGEAEPSEAKGQDRRRQPSGHGGARKVSASPLETFLRGAGSLTPDERLTIVNQAILMLEGFYVHLPLKRAMHGVDPLQRLRLLRHRLGRVEQETRFHAEMTAIFTSVRDLHTNYKLPAPYKGVIASLPFVVEDCFEGPDQHYIVGATSGPMPDPAFEVGVAITHWNGIPISRAVANAADRHAGSNPAARHSRGLAGLTHRPLVVVLPPDEEWVTVDYIGLDGAARQTRFEWLVQELGGGAQGAGAAADADAGAEADALGEPEAALGFDLETVEIQRARQALFAPQVEEAEQALAGAGADPLDGVEGTASILPGVFTARAVKTRSGTFGYIRIRTFMVLSDRQFVDEFVRLAELMPRDGLIIDVRDNGGGVIFCGERLLQTLTPREIEPERLQFINTASTQALVDVNPDLSAWAPSIRRSVETGAAFSCSFPITSPERCNDIGQVYRGPVVLITNARCYSTTDIFAAGFQDHEIGEVLGVDDNTGAGGANVWEHQYLQQRLGKASMLKPLPKGADMRVAIRRTVRVGAQAGTELEDLGVVPDGPLHRMTRRDVLEGNIDLIEEAGARLARMPRYGLDATVAKLAGMLRVDVTTSNIDRLDFALDGRPQRSDDVFDGTHRIDVATALARGTLSLKGFQAGKLVAATRIRF